LGGAVVQHGAGGVRVLPLSDEDTDGWLSTEKSPSPLIAI